ncbi:MAG: endolytic transglycosylase MltG [Deltaproteobacteria bacterium]|nr:endolytic transglycosylase MltG [Deltaproteobacteria bacterium]
MQENKSKKIAILILASSIICLLLVLVYIPCDLNDTEKVVVTVKQGTRVSEIAQILKEKELIPSKSLFIIASLIFGRRLLAGEYEFQRNLSTMHIIRMMKKGERRIYLVKIIEGSSILDVSRMLEQNLVMKRDDFLRLATDKEFLNQLKIPSGSIEGYLAPETYYYSKEITVEELIAKIVSRTFKFFEDEEIKKRMAQLNLDVHKTLTLASLIEKEAKLEIEKPLISAVFHNRLKLGMPLECDPTVLYGIDKKGPITKEDLKRKTDYNTYTFRGLPPGPICNPSTSSIRAALFPSNVDYLYFVSRNDGSHVFSTNLREHSKYVKLYQRRNNNVIN